MRDDDEDDIVEIDTSDTDEYPLDSVAARVVSFTKLLALVDHIKTEEAQKEAILMLRAVRRSFKTIPIADELTQIQGGKT
jgi:ribosomal silencing factor RsfS